MELDQKMKSQIMNLSHKPKLPVKGVIFDLDGVLTNTSEFHYLAWKRLADEEQIRFTRKDNEALRGIPRRESLLLILKDRPVSETQIEEMMTRKNQYYQEFISTITENDLLPGAREILENLHVERIKIAIGSASKNAKSVIEKLGISGFLNAVADGTSVKRQKPAPDLFLHASQLIGIPAAQCVVFEDAGAGIEAALSGGMWAIGIGPQKRFENAHLVFKNLNGVTIKKITELLTRVSNS